MESKQKSGGKYNGPLPVESPLHSSINESTILYEEQSSFTKLNQ
jgi:hypothetical protein